MAGPWYIGEKKVVRKFSIKYKDVFSMRYLYRRVHEWLMEEDYWSEKSSQWGEKLYLERISGNGNKELWIWWRSSKNYTQSFFKFYMDIDYHVLDLKDKEIVVDGKKVKTHDGEVEVLVTASIQLDPDKSWNKNFILKNFYLQNFFLNRIYKTRIVQAENQLIEDAAKLLGAVKQYLQLESWVSEFTRRPFHPAKGAFESK